MPLNLDRAGDEIFVTGRRYRLCYKVGSPEAELFVEAKRAARLFLPCALDTAEGPDATLDVGQPQVQQARDHVRLRIPVRSARWRAKTVVVGCWEEAVELGCVVEGEGTVRQYRLCGGVLGRAEKVSETGFATLFNPHPNLRDVRYHRAWESTQVDPYGGEGDNRIFTPGLLCYAVTYDGKWWMGLGVGAAKGGYGFNRFSYNGGRGFWLALDYEGHLRIKGRFRAPQLVISFDSDEYGALESYVEHLLNRELISWPDREAAHWWWQPIFCGWGEQCLCARRSSQPATTYAEQSNYEAWLELLAGRGVVPGTIVVGDKWQCTYGENVVDGARFTNMRRFIESRHARGQKVVLWIKAWHPEGIPPEECIVDGEGNAVAVDPTNPRFEQRLREQVRYHLSAAEDCLNADGYMIDFTHLTPHGAELSAEGEAWGIELLRRLMELYYTAAKQTKSDALIIAQCANPYFADVVDMISLDGVAPEIRNLCDTMTFRQRVAKIACPHWLVDTDRAHAPNLEEWRLYMPHQPKIGVPSLSVATGQPTTGEMLEEGDYAMLREVWEEYRKRVGL